MKRGDVEVVHTPRVQRRLRNHESLRGGGGEHRRDGNLAALAVGQAHGGGV
jgi:hypothetical protein